MAEVAGTSTETTIAGVVPGIHTYSARAMNVWESQDSNEAKTPAVSAAPVPKITVQVTVTVTQK
jgi:hypothetical protein